MDLARTQCKHLRRSRSHSVESKDDNDVNDSVMDTNSWVPAQSCRDMVAVAVISMNHNCCKLNDLRCNVFAN